jgi:hypothetical protein
LEDALSGSADSGQDQCVVEGTLWNPVGKGTGDFLAGNQQGTLVLHDLDKCTS